MSVLHFIRVFCIFYFIFDSCVQHAEAKYKLKLISFKKCKIPPEKEFKNPPLTYTLSSRKVDRQTTLLQVRFSITKREGPVYFGVRGYQVQQSSSRDLFLNLQKIPCTNPLSYQLVTALNLKLDNECYAMPGNYSADKINIDDFAWILTKAMIGTGKYSYDLEVGSDKGTAVCISIVCDIS